MQTGNSITLSGKEAKALGQRLRVVLGAGRKRARAPEGGGLWSARLAVMNGGIAEVDYGDADLLVIEKLPCESTGAPVRLEVDGGALADVLIKAPVRKDSVVKLTEITAAPPGGWSAGCLASMEAKGQPVNISIPAGAAFGGAQDWEATGAWTATLAQGELGRALAATAISISTDETRYYLTGVFFTPHEGRLRIVSTDGHRLGVCDLESEFTPAPESGGKGWPDGSFICPARAVKALQALEASRPPDSVRITAPAEGHAVITGNWWTALVKPIDGSFPDFDRVIPRKFSGQVDVDCGTLAEALAAVVAETGGASEHYRAVKLDIGSGTIELSRCVPTNTGRLEASRVVPCLRAGNPPASIGFNARFLDEFLDVIGGGNGKGLPTGRLSFAMLDERNAGEEIGSTPVMLKPADPDGRLGVLMPMRV